MRFMLLRMLGGGALKRYLLDYLNNRNHGYIGRALFARAKP